jgi:hypothetical protein
MKRALRRDVALVVIGLIAGVTLLAPATAHVGVRPAHLWKKHLLPLAKKAFYTKSASNARYESKVARPGSTETGVYSFGTSDPTGGVETTIEFDQKLPAGIPASNVHFVTTALTAQCPSPGRAAAGHLCVYSIHQQNATFQSFYDPTSTSATGTSREGVVMVFVGTGTTPNGRGVWAVRPAAP